MSRITPTWTDLGEGVDIVYDTNKLIYDLANDRNFSDARQRIDQINQNIERIQSHIESLRETEAAINRQLEALGKEIEEIDCSEREGKKVLNLLSNLLDMDAISSGDARLSEKMDQIDLDNFNQGDSKRSGGDGNDLLVASEAGGSLIGGAGNDTLSGGRKSDELSGSRGNDLAIGALGADTLSGGGGNDRLWGGSGNDQMSGGAGKDEFIFDRAVKNGSDRIVDFNPREDKLEIWGARFADLTIRLSDDGSGDARVRLGAHLDLVLENVQPSELEASTFLFV